MMLGLYLGAFLTFFYFLGKDLQFKPGAFQIELGPDPFEEKSSKPASNPAREPKPR
jgi:hypothetical protein